MPPKWNYEKALDLRPNYPKAHNNLGMLFLDRGRFAEARRSFQQAVLA